MLEVTLLTWRQQRGGLIGWGIGFFVLALMIIAFYPVIGEEYQTLYDSLPEEMRQAFSSAGDVGTPEGFLGVEYLSYIGVVYAIFAVGQGARQLAGEEQDGTFDILLAQPLSRTRVVLEKVLASTLAILAMGLAGSLGLILGSLMVGVDADYGAFALVGLDLVPLTLVVYGLALLGSALFHQRSRATLLATVYSVAAYFINLFAPLADQLDPLKWASIFSYFGRSDALHRDLDPLYWLLSLGLAAALIAGATLWFERKDVYG